MRRDVLWTLPNLVSFSRLGMAAAFVMLRGREERLLLIAAAAATDFLDGFLARTRGQATRLGALIDPIADRGFVLAAVAAFLVDDVLSVWRCAVLLLRDVATMIGFVIAQFMPRLRAFTFRARLSGKVVTVLQLATLAAALVAPSWVPLMIIGVGVVSVGSIGDYTRELMRAHARG